MKKTSKILLLCLALIMCFSIVACSAGKENASDSIGSESGSSSIVEGDIDRKIVYNVYLDIETENVKKLRDNFAKKCDSVGGYVSFNDEDYNEGELESVHVTYRIPTDQLDAFIEEIEGQGKVENKNVSLQDITTSYVNAEAKKSALEERKSQLEELLTEQGISAGEKITIINEISSVNTELMEIGLLIDGYDSMVDYSTVEVYIEKPTTFLEIFFAVTMFCIVPIAVPVVIVVVIVKKSKRKDKSI